MLVGIADPELISIGQVVKDAARPEEVMRWIGNRLRERPEAERLGGSDGVHCR